MCLQTYQLYDLFLKIAVQQITVCFNKSWFERACSRSRVSAPAPSPDRQNPYKQEQFGEYIHILNKIAGPTVSTYLNLKILNVIHMHTDISPLETCLNIWISQLRCDPGVADKGGGFE